MPVFVSPCKNSASAHGIRIVPVPNTGSASTTVMTSAARTGYRTRSSSSPAFKIRNVMPISFSCARSQPPSVVRTCPPSVCSFSSHAGRTVRRSQLRMAGSSPESMKLDKIAVTANSTASGSRPMMPDAQEKSVS